ncbi:hypothetical protein ACHAXT_002625 [Thalassiosira profunda]
MARKRGTPQRFQPGQAQSSSHPRSKNGAPLDVPAARTWIYAARTAPNGGGAVGSGVISEEGYELYLGSGVQRPLVRGVGESRSGAPGSHGANDGEASARGVAFAPVPLPPQEPAANADAPAADPNDAYSKFTAPLVTNASRAKFTYGLNHGTLVPGKNVMSYVGRGESGYVLQMPLVRGTVVGYSPPLDAGYGNNDEETAEEAEFPTERQRPDEPLFRILWEGQSAENSGEEDRKADDGEIAEDADAAPNASAAGYTEDVTLAELLPCLVAPPEGLSARQTALHKKKLAPPHSHTQYTLQSGASDGSQVAIPAKLLAATASGIHKHVRATVTRRQLALEWKMAHEILPHVAVVAALELRRELAQKIRLEILLERRRLRTASGAEVGPKKKGAEDAVNADGRDFGYYAEHPNRYMPSFQPPPPLPSDDEASDEDGEDELEAGGNGRRKKHRSATKLTPAELVKFHARLEERCHLAPSKIAERAKLACATAYDSASARGLLDAYYAATERRKERELAEALRLSREWGGTGHEEGAGGRSRGPGGIDGTGEVRRSGRARTAVNYAADGAAEREVDAVLRQDGGGTGSLDGAGLPRENVSGGPTARHLLGLLGMLPEEMDDKAGETGDGGQAEGDEEEEDEDEEESEEEKPEENDPFFAPDPRLILDQLGRKGRYLSPAEVQAAIVHSIEAHSVETPSCLLDEEEAADGHPRATDLVCTSGDRVADLGHFEPASFARCRFAPHTFVVSAGDDDDDAMDEDDAAEIAEARRRKEARAAARREARRAAAQKRNAELERAYRAKKAFELWRFRSLHGDGCAAFPSWEERSRELLREVIGADDAAPEGAAAAAPAAGAATSGADAEPAAAAEPSMAEAAAAPDDEALARALASDAAADAEPLAKRRRTARRTAAGGDEPVFYGGHTAMSKEQLLDALVRLLRHSAPAGGATGTMSLMDLKRAVFPDGLRDGARGGAAEMKKLRGALGGLAYRLGRIGRLAVDVEGDEACAALLAREGALVQFVGDAGEASAAGDRPVAELAAVAGAADAAGGAAIPPAETSAAPRTDDRLKSQLRSLESYVAGLHRTELALRKALMRAVDRGFSPKDEAGTLLQLSTTAIATAADETEGAADAEDWRCFLPPTDENGGTALAADRGEKIPWRGRAGDHALLGQVLCRPQSSLLRPAGQEGGGASDPTAKCHFYRIVSYTPSVTAAPAADQPPPPNDGETDAPPNAIVERRARFRAVPVAEADIDAPFPGVDADDDEAEYMVLTEAQARAGMEAAAVWRALHSGEKKASAAASTEGGNGGRGHPFRNGHGSRVMLTPRPEGGPDGDPSNVVYGVIAGHDRTDDGKFKLLVLLEEEADEGKKEGGQGDEEKRSCAFWATVDAAGAVLSEIRPAAADAPPQAPLAASYAVEMHEYYPGSPAYGVCESVVAYLKNHAKAGPFLAPVDVVALGIPDYFAVISHPMDISTLEANLAEGKYSRLPPRPNDDDAEEREGHDSPVYRMVWGPFWTDVQRIFDNCIRYNGLEGWIGNEAKVFKKQARSKMEHLVRKALFQGGGGGAASAYGASSRRAAGRGVYAEVDSDVDMYEYESEYDDDDECGGGRKSRRARGKGGSGARKRAAKEDRAADAIERPFAFPDRAHGYGAGGAFPHLKVQTNVGKFTLSSGEWSCRYVKEDTIAERNAAANEEDPAEDEMRMLLQLQQEEDAAAAGGRVRRSTRERHAPKNYAEEEYAPSAATAAAAPQAPVVLPGVEYYLTNEAVFRPGTAPDGADEPIPTACRSRLGAEGVRETIHERFYARLYRDHAPHALLLEGGLGRYVEGSFPPYLGRVVPSGDGTVAWEIREPYLVPALRWVLRGLVKSGHLAEVDGSLSDGLSDDAPAIKSFAAGVVVPSHEYYYCGGVRAPYDVLDEREILRRRRQDAAAAESEESEEEVELSAYEQMRAERVARNAERLKALGLA